MSHSSQAKKEGTKNPRTLNNATVTIVHQGIPRVHESRVSLDNDRRTLGNPNNNAPEMSSATNWNATPRATRSLTTNIPNGGSAPIPKPCKDKECDILQAQESRLKGSGTRPTRSMVFFSMENNLIKMNGRFSASPGTAVHSHGKQSCSTESDESNSSSNQGSNGKGSAPRLNLSNNKVAPSPYRDAKSIILAAVEGEEAVGVPSSTPSSTSYDSLADVCRICQDNPSKLQLMMPCRCKGSMGMVHLSCLERWLSESGKNSCEICGHEYHTVRKPKYTGFSALCAWIRQPLTANDTRNLFFDIACFFILTPLAAVSGWLCVSGAQSYTLEHRFYTPRKFADKNEPSNSTWTAVGLLSLTATVAVAYLVWLCIAIRYHKKVFNEWQLRNYTVTIVPFDGTVSVAIESREPPGQLNNVGNVQDGNNNENIAQNGNNNENMSDLSGSPRSSNNSIPNCGVTLEDELIFASIYESDSMDRMCADSSFLPEIIINSLQEPVQSTSNRNSGRASSNSS